MVSHVNDSVDASGADGEIGSALGIDEVGAAELGAAEGDDATGTIAAGEEAQPASATASPKTAAIGAKDAKRRDGMLMR
jgi:hypothetical protein